jgi:transposase
VEQDALVGVAHLEQIADLLGLGDQPGLVRAAFVGIWAQMNYEQLTALFRVEERSLAFLAASLVNIAVTVVATVLLSSIGNARHFDNGRQMSAWVGLVPRHTGTGGVTRILGITKNGDRELRTMLIHGARAVVRWADRRDDALGRWIRQLKERRGANRAAVALANKMIRIAWAVVARGERFNLNKAFNT